ncbi:MAG: 2Fe-2S iron-sulfur cluster binding domain-containing protein [Alphaproteobacteria bacterium]|nr:2Fe-2S iron-sulfur cluster binding domain-containing protein [Alphaproteobacteria bacterium]MBV9692907.1 2Fe-2S iron-sulfur cluster binding domain-containing protein [Alphaproteobacteria bacterium]
MSLNKGFHRLTIAEVRRETPDSISVLFALPDDLRDLFAYKAGQHLTLRTEIAGQDVRRTYSLCTPPGRGELRIAIKQMPGGVFSGWANTELQSGATVEVLPPMGRFVVPQAAGGRSFVALAGGSGITPIISILAHTLENDSASRFTLLYGNRNTPSIMFLEQLAGLKDRFLDRFALYHFLEDEAEDIELFNGRLDREKCDEVFSHLIEVNAVDTFFICGPGPMMDTAEASLRARGVPADRILVERFSTSLPSSEQVARGEVLQSKAAGAELQVVLDGRRTRLQFDPAKGNILESVQAAGLHAPYACRGGVCTTCRAKVLEGRAEMLKNYGLTPDEVAQGYVLTCQAVPESDRVVLSYDE